jgi:hypothetical protein
MAKSKTVREFDAKAVAGQIEGHLSDACADVAANLIRFPDLDEKWAKKVKAAKRKGVSDVAGWLADEIYNDADSVQDLIGDQLHDLTNGDDERDAVLDVLAKGAHPALLVACEALRPDPFAPGVQLRVTAASPSGQAGLVGTLDHYATEEATGARLVAFRESDLSPEGLEHVESVRVADDRRSRRKA